MNKIVPLKFTSFISKLELLHSHPEFFSKASSSVSCGTSNQDPQLSTKGIWSQWRTVLYMSPTACTENVWRKISDRRFSELAKIKLRQALNLKHTKHTVYENSQLECQLTCFVFLHHLLLAFLLLKCHCKSCQKTFKKKRNSGKHPNKI